LMAIYSLWVGVYLAFLFFWYPYFTPYRIFYLPALILLCGIAITGYEIQGNRTFRLYAAMFVIAVAISNFLFFIFPLSHIEKNPPLVLALEMAKIWPPGTVIYHVNSNAEYQLFRYFNPATRWRKLEMNGDDDLKDELKEIYQSGGEAWIEASALDQQFSNQTSQSWANWARSGRKAELITDAHRISFVQIFPPTYNARVQPVTSH